MLAVIDYGAGNLRSVLHALKHLNARDVVIVQTPEQLIGADKVILPGVGAFGAGMKILRERGLEEAVKTAVDSGVPYLGICLGMQFLFDVSNEMGEHTGLSIVPGRVTRFENRPDLKVPHMGWNHLTINRPTSLFQGLTDNPYAYFVHSYFCIPEDPTVTTATVTYGDPFCVAVQQGHVFGVQFHPEKSQRTGLRVLSNFLQLPGKAAA